MKVIDFENHFYAPVFLNYLQTRTDYPYLDPKTRILYHFEGTYTPFNYKMPGTDVEALDFGADMGELRLAGMDHAGISTAALSSSVGIEELDKENAVKYAQITNNALAEACKKYPDRFMGTIALPTIHVDEAIKELERAKNELGFKYWHTHSNYGNENLSDDKFIPLLAKCEELNCPIYVHPYQANTSYLSNYGSMFASAGFGYGVDTMRTLLKFILNGRFDQFPRLKVIMGHMAEFFPYIMKRLDNRFFFIPDPDVKCEHNFTYYFENKNIFMTTSGITDSKVMEFAMSAIGTDTILFGSDFPAEDAKEEIDFINSLPVSDEVKEKIFHKNAEKYIL